jgi:hypothetical protein
MGTTKAGSMGPERTPVDGLLAEATQTVLATLTDAGATARLGPPADEPDQGGGLCVWPLALVPDRVAPSTPDALRLRAQFLVAGGGDAESIALIDRALLAAAGDPQVCLVPEPLSAQTWAALQVRPRAALVVEVAIRLPRPTPTPVRVRGPLRIADAPLTTLRGRVLGPDAVPVPGAVVRATDIGVSTHTGRDGSFALSGVPATESVHLLVSARGARLSTQISPRSAEPLVLSLPIDTG